MKRIINIALLALFLSVLTVTGQSPVNYGGKDAINIGTMQSKKVSTATNQSFAVEYTDTNIWEDLLFPASVWNPPGTPSAATLVFNVGPSLDMLALGFADAAENVAVGRAQLRHDWRTSEPDLYVHVHWMPNTTATGVVAMALIYTEAGLGSTYYPSRTNIMYFGATNEQWKHKMATFPAVPATNNPTVSHGLNMTVKRLGNDGADTWAGICYVTDIDVHFKVRGSGAPFIPATP